MTDFHNRFKRILIFGGTGSLGKALIERFAAHVDVHVASRDESKHWTIKQQLRPDQRVKFHVCDVRNFTRVLEVIELIEPDVIISAAALKHVDTCELSPIESMLTNVDGPRNIVEACKTRLFRGRPVGCVVQISTDKACEPVNVYGMCKALSERIFTSQEFESRTLCVPSPRFVVVRYGNVLESRGSIVPLFKWQAENSRALTVTDPDMTRFVMTLEQSVELIQLAIERAENGETWVPRLPSMRIGDIASIFAEKYNKSIESIPVRPGEKRHETLVGTTEATRTLDFRSHTGTGPSHYVIESQAVTPRKAHSAFNFSRIEKYTSNDDVLSRDQLKLALSRFGVIDAAMSKFTGQSIEEIRTK